MNLQPAGVILAAVTFSTIGAGHVLVRRLHALYGTRPAFPLFALGLLFLYASTRSGADLLSGALGITAVTVLWDGIEMFRQKRRVRRETK